MPIPGDRRREQKAWQEVLQEGRKQQVMLKGALTPPSIATLGDGRKVIEPTSMDVWIMYIDDDYTPPGDFRRVWVSDEVVKVAVFDPSLPTTAANTDKSGAYGLIELINGMYQLVWVGC